MVVLLTFSLHRC